MKKLTAAYLLVFVFILGACESPEKILSQDYKKETDQYTVFISRGDLTSESTIGTSYTQRKYENAFLSSVIEEIYPKNASLSLIELPYNAHFPVKIELMLKNGSELDMDSLLRVHLQEALKYQVERSEVETTSYKLSIQYDKVALQQDTSTVKSKMVMFREKEFTCENCDLSAVQKVLQEALGQPITLTKGLAEGSRYSFHIDPNSDISYIKQLEEEGFMLSEVTMQQPVYVFTLTTKDWMKSIWETLGGSEE